MATKPPKVEWIAQSQQAYVSAGSVLHHQLPVASSGRYVQIDFAVLAGNDIGFRVVHESALLPARLGIDERQQERGGRLPGARLSHDANTFCIVLRGTAF